MITLTLLLLLGLLWFRLKPNGSSRSSDPWYRVAVGRFNRLKGSFRDRQNSGRPFKAWAARLALTGSTPGVGLPEEMLRFKAWMGRLSDRRANAFARSLAAFCHPLHLQPAWLFDPQAGNEIKSGLQEMTLLYGAAVQRSNELQAFLLLRSLRTGLHGSQQRAFAQALYLRLAEAGLVSTPAGMLLASEKERYAHVVHAIQAALLQNHAAVVALADEVYSENEAVRQERSRPEKALEPLTPAARAIEILA